jgi:hypothetical protein
MQPKETAARPDRRRLKLAALLGAAVLAIPGAGIVSNAFAAEGGSGSPSTQQQAPADGEAFPVQTQDENAPDGRDCPEENGGSGNGNGSGRGSGESGTSADTAL